MSTPQKNTVHSNDTFQESSFQESSFQKSSFQKFAPKAIVLLSLLTVISSATFLTQGWNLMDFNLAVLAALSALVLLLNLQLAKGGAISPKKKLLIKIMHHCSYVPYLFGIYLFLFKGYWSLTIMMSSFSVMLLVMSIFYLICGHFVVNAGYQSCPEAKRKSH